MEAKLVVVGGDAKATEIQLKLPTLIGRGKGSKLRLQHPLVSRQHCEIYEVEGQLKVRDLGSLNGTFVNNERITEAALPSGQLLTVGAVTFRAVYESEEVPDFSDANKTVTLDQTVTEGTLAAADMQGAAADSGSQESMEIELELPQPAVSSAAAADEDIEFDIDDVEEVEDASGILPPSAVPKGGAPTPAVAPVVQPSAPLAKPAVFAPPPTSSDKAKIAADEDDDDLNMFLKSLGK